MANKITVSQKFDAVIDFLRKYDADESLIDFIYTRKDLHSKKISKSQSVKDKAETKEILVAIKNFMVNENKPLTITEINNGCSVCQNFTNQKVTALVNMLDGIGRKTIKGKSVYTIEG